EDEEESLTEEEIEKLLIDRGKSKLNEHKRTFFLEAQIVTPSFPSIEQHFALQTFYEYETDFNLGDTVDVFNSRWGVTMSAPITEFKEIHEEGGFLLEATFGEAQPTLIKKIKNKFDDLEGIEKQEYISRMTIGEMEKAMDYADDRISKEEKERIEQALKNLEESKKYADEEAYQAEQEAKRHADAQDIVYDDIAKNDATDKANQAEDNSKDYADGQDIIYDNIAKEDATNKADK